MNKKLETAALTAQPVTGDAALLKRIAELEAVLRSGNFTYLGGEYVVCLKPDVVTAVMNTPLALATVAPQPAQPAWRDEGITDADRLDFLDECNRRLNASYGTNYSWKMVMNHNVNRLMLGSMKVDLNDADAKGLKSCRNAIDAEMQRVGYKPFPAAPSNGRAE